MILYGQLDSPFVRRVAVTMQHYKIPFERRAMSVFGDFAELQRTNPLGKVPALVLDGGETIYESSFILDYLDEQADPDRSLTPPAGVDRRAVLRLTAIGLGLAEKSVELRGETARRPEALRYKDAITRIEGQITAALDWLESQAGGNWLFGRAMTQADVTVTIAITNLAAKLPDLYDARRCPALQALSETCEALPVFQTVAYGEH